MKHILNNSRARDGDEEEKFVFMGIYLYVAYIVKMGYNMKSIKKRKTHVEKYEKKLSSNFLYEKRYIINF